MPALNLEPSDRCGLRRRVPRPEHEGNADVLTLTYGFSPTQFGHYYFIVRGGENYDWLPTNLKEGDLVVRHPSTQTVNKDATSQPNFMRLRQHERYTYYMFSPLAQSETVRFVPLDQSLRIEVGRPVTLEIRTHNGNLVLVVVNPGTGDEVEQYEM